MERGATANERIRPTRGQHAYHPLRLLAAALREEAAHAAGPILDLGCGSKPYDSLLPHPSIGLDVQHTHGDPDAVAFAEHLPIRGGSIGTALSTQQLEHVEDPELVLREARRVLITGGRLLLSTHGVWAHHPDPKDLWRWTEEGLVSLVASNGFRVERTHRLGGSVLAGVLLASYPLAGVSRHRSAKRHLARLALALVNVVVGPLDRLVERLAPRHYGSVGYLVVAVAVERGADTRTTSPGLR